MSEQEDQDRPGSTIYMPSILQSEEDLKGDQAKIIVTSDSASECDSEIIVTAAAASAKRRGAGEGGRGPDHKYGTFSEWSGNTLIQSILTIVY